MASKKKRKQIRKKSDVLHSFEGKTLRLDQSIESPTPPHHTCDIVKLIKRSPKGIWSVKVGQGGVNSELKDPIGNFFLYDTFFHITSMSDKELIKKSTDFKVIYRERTFKKLL